MLNHLCSGFFQLGYVARDLDRARQHFSKQFGITELLMMDTPGAPSKRIGIAYIDDVMIELIEVDTSQPNIYIDALPDDPDKLRLHHFGYLIDDYPATLARLEGQGYAVPMHGSFGEALDYIYADTRADLGHYSEYIRLGEQGAAMFAQAPRHRSK